MEQKISKSSRNSIHVSSLIQTWMMSLPFSNGFLYWGMPSPLTIFRSPVLITSPSCIGMKPYLCCFRDTPLTVWMTRVLSSKVFTAFFKPVSASVKLMSIFIIRSCMFSYQKLHSCTSETWSTCPLRLKSAWAFSSRTMMMSPGSRPGSWSPSPEKVTFCPSSIPLSTDTSKIFLSRFTLRPLHFLHLEWFVD